MRFEGTSRERRRPGLTPLIDVVFLLLVFFMLASRFDLEGSLPLVVRAGASAAPVADVLRVRLGDDGRTRVAGAIVDRDELLAAAARAEADGRGIVVAPDPEAKLQAIVDTLAAFERGGVASVSLESPHAP